MADYVAAVLSEEMPDSNFEGAVQREQRRLMAAGQHQAWSRADLHRHLAGMWPMLTPQQQTTANGMEHRLASQHKYQGKAYLGVVEKPGFKRPKKKKKGYYNPA